MTSLSYTAEGSAPETYLSSTQQSSLPAVALKKGATTPYITCGKVALADETNSLQASLASQNKDVFLAHVTT